MNNELWHADITVTDEIVTHCLQEQFPSLMPVTIKLIGEGWDNKAFLINEKFIFRFPRRQIAVELIERENIVLKNLQALSLPIAIPAPVYIGKPTTRYPYPFHGYSIIPGISACHAQLTNQQRSASLPLLAHFLKQLHSIDKTQALAMGAQPQIFDRTNINSNINKLRERVDKIIANKICIINKDCFQQELEIAQKIILPKHDQCLVHGDLYSRHLLFNQGQLTGIIDWGDTGINNKSVDLAVIWEFYPPDYHQQFFDLYGTVDPATWQYARFLGLYGMLTVVLYAHAIGDNLLVSEAINSIKRINAGLLFSSSI